MKYLSAHQRLWLIGPIALVMFWLYSMAVQLKGVWRLIFGLPFMLLNILFNVVCGSIIFLEFPRELFFTDRLKRHKAGGNEEYRQIATEICKEMNKADPGHC